MGQVHANSGSTGTEQLPDDGTKPHSYLKAPEGSWPVVHSPAYNISILGMEKFGAFDLAKGTKVRQLLITKQVLTESQLIEPLEVTQNELETVHSTSFIRDFDKGSTIAELTGMSALRMMPNFMVQRSILQPFRFQTGGTILVGKLAMEHGWAINLGGGAHHCSAERIGAFSPYADITLNIRYLRDNFPDVKKVMVIDLDVHQGNGYERDFLGDEDVFILDVYNCTIYPQDEDAKKAIRCKVELRDATENREYLDLVQRHVGEAVESFNPQYILYNAGVDILKGDPLGHFNITPDGVVERDRLVFAAARSRNVPIAMVTSGGFIRSAPNVIADSIVNLHKLGLINGPKSNIVIDE